MIIKNLISLIVMILLFILGLMLRINETALALLMTICIMSLIIFRGIRRRKE